MVELFRAAHVAAMHTACTGPLMKKALSVLHVSREHVKDDPPPTRFESDPHAHRARPCRMVQPIDEVGRDARERAIAAGTWSQ
jgi:hypothetical protein